MIVMAEGGLYEARRNGAEWTARVKLPAEINVNGSEIGAVFSPSGASLLFSRDTEAQLFRGVFSVAHPRRRNLALAVSSKEEMKMTQATASRTTQHQAFIKGVHGVRYQVKDVARAVEFYTEHLGFTLEHQHLPAFAKVSLGGADVLLSGPGASGSRPMPNGQTQEARRVEPGRAAVVDLPACIAALKPAGIRFRNEMEAGPAADKSRYRIPTEIRSNCSSRPDDPSGYRGRSGRLVGAGSTARQLSSHAEDVVERVAGPVEVEQRGEPGQPALAAAVHHARQHVTQTAAHVAESAARLRRHGVARLCFAM